MYQRAATVTFFPLGARVLVQAWASHTHGVGELVGIGRKYLAVRLDSGPLVTHLHPASIIRSGDSTEY